MNHVALVTGLLLTAKIHAHSALEITDINHVTGNPTAPAVTEQCGMYFDTPDLKNVSDRVVGFGCTGSYKNGGKAIMEMGFEYDPNFDPRGGDSIVFVVEKVGVWEKLSEGSGVLRLSPNGEVLVLNPAATYKESNCGDPVIETIFSPIEGGNWTGWISEETFASSNEGCEPAREYTERYRCIHAMVGNKVMSAQLNGVCLLRKTEYSLENGFSYDLFLDMLGTLRFGED